MKYYECPECGASLDPGEKCSCIEEKREQEEQYLKSVSQDNDGQIRIVIETAD